MVIFKSQIACKWAVYSILKAILKFTLCDNLIQFNETEFKHLDCVQCAKWYLVRCRWEFVDPL